MRRILVPLDGSDHAALILPDATRLAGPGGTLVLIQAVSPRALDLDHEVDRAYTQAEAAAQYLAGVATSLRRQGYAVDTQVFVMDGPSAAIEEAIRLFEPDLVACATHARAGVSRLLSGSVAWQALSHSPVPMLLRHADGPSLAAEPEHRTILVPLDGSPLAEAALPLAEQLALEWDAELYLARVVPLDPRFDVLGHSEDMREAHAYLAGVPVYRQEGRAVTRSVRSGTPIEALAALVENRGITDLVMASHGRTGLARIAVGSVAAGLLHRVHCPVLVVPALAARAEEIRRQPTADTVLSR